MAKAIRGLLRRQVHGGAVALALAGALVAGADRPAVAADGGASLEVRPGVFFEVVELKRLSQKGIVGLTFAVDNKSTETVTLAEIGISDNERRVTDLKLIDFENGKDYWLGSTGGDCLCSIFDGGGPVEPGQKKEFWAWFGAPPAGVDKLAVFVPGMPPMFDVPLTK